MMLHTNEEVGCLMWGGSAGVFSACSKTGKAALEGEERCPPGREEHEEAEGGRQREKVVA